MNSRKFFTEEQQKSIRQAIQEAEMNTSGEVRVHLESSCKEEVVDRAKHIFEKLKMHETEQRNGVLFYLAVSDKKFAILGDQGINNKVPADFWDSIRDEMVKHFQLQDFTSGLIDGISHAGEKLKAHFPYQTDDVNELSDDISFNEDL
jgi:uncharacterized membrane protein